MSDTSARAAGRVNSATDDADRAVLEAIAGGDHGAIEVLYERYKTMSYGLALRITGDAGLADDARRPGHHPWAHFGRWVGRPGRSRPGRIVWANP